jgi:hypothetical protein
VTNFILVGEFILKQDIFGFLVKNLDLDSNLNNMKSSSKKLNIKSKKFLTWFLDLLTRLAHPGSVGPLSFFWRIVFSEVDLPRKRKKVRNSTLGFFEGTTPSDPLGERGTPVFLAESFYGSIYRIDLPKKQIKNCFFHPLSYAHHLVHVNAPHLRKEKFNGFN